MIARLHIILPFSLTIQEGTRFNIYQFEARGYDIRIYPPFKSDQSQLNNNVEEITVNKEPAVHANTLRVDFIKGEFDRRGNIECDPPIELIALTINRFLAKLRFITRSSQIRPLKFPLTGWHVRYLNDDETELEEKEGFIKERGTIQHSSSWIVLNNAIWNDIFKLSPNYVPPHWDSLLLDAIAMLPEVGPSIVLAATALDVFISYVLNKLAVESSVPGDLWEWINNRKFYLKGLNTQEQYDGLLKIMLGTSLKDDNDLWESFKNIRNARNSFIHEGVAKIGEKELTEDDASRLTKRAHEVVSFIRDRLPEKFHWTEFKY